MARRSSQLITFTLLMIMCSQIPFSNQIHSLKSTTMLNQQKSEDLIQTTVQDKEKNPTNSASQQGFLTWDQEVKTEEPIFVNKNESERPQTQITSEDNSRSTIQEVLQSNYTQAVQDLPQQLEQIYVSTRLNSQRVIGRGGSRSRSSSVVSNYTSSGKINAADTFLVLGVILGIVVAIVIFAVTVSWCRGEKIEWKKKKGRY
eukprot:403372646